MCRVCFKFIRHFQNKVKLRKNANSWSLWSLRDLKHLNLLILSQSISLTFLFVRIDFEEREITSSEIFASVFLNKSAFLSLTLLELKNGGKVFPWISLKSDFPLCQSFLLIINLSNLKKNGFPPPPVTSLNQLNMWIF